MVQAVGEEPIQENGVGKSHGLGHELLALKIVEVGDRGEGIEDQCCQLGFLVDLAAFCHLNKRVGASALVAQDGAGELEQGVLQIILKDQYATYTMACVTLNTLTLDQRSEQLCLTFAKKNLKSEKTFFTLDDNPINTRRKKKVVKEFKCRTSRYEKSSLPYLAKLLNNNN